MITHEQMRERINNINEFDLVDTEVMTLDYITQQEKVSKLLELYRLEKELREQYYTADIVLMSQKILDMVRGVAEEIQALEEELK